MPQYLTEREFKVWIGAGTDRAHLNVEQAILVRDALSEFIKDATA